MANQITVADLGQAQTAWATNPSPDEQIACGHLSAAVFTVESNHRAKLHMTIARLELCQVKPLPRIMYPIRANRCVRGGAIDALRVRVRLGIT